jgi:hypothetical protein
MKDEEIICCAPKAFMSCACSSFVFVGEFVEFTNRSINAYAWFFVLVTSV